MSTTALTAADASDASDDGATTLATRNVNAEGDDFATHVEKLIAGKQRETPNLLLELRSSLATPSARLEGAEKMKLEANSSLSSNPELSMRSYLTALWLLRLDDPPVLYDSVYGLDTFTRPIVDDPKDPATFVTFHDAAAYPAYIVEFTQD